MLIDRRIAQRQERCGITGRRWAHDLLVYGVNEGRGRGVGPFHVKKLGDLGRELNAISVGAFHVFVEDVQLSQPLVHQVPALRRQLVRLQGQDTQASQLGGVLVLHRPSQHRHVHHVVRVEVGIKAELRTVGDLADEIDDGRDVVRVLLEGFVGRGSHRALHQGLVSLRKSLVLLGISEGNAKLIVLCFDLAKGGSDLVLKLCQFGCVGGCRAATMLGQFDEVDQWSCVGHALSLRACKLDLRASACPNEEQHDQQWHHEGHGNASGLGWKADGAKKSHAWCKPAVIPEKFAKAAAIFGAARGRR